MLSDNRIEIVPAANGWVLEIYCMKPDFQRLRYVAETIEELQPYLTAGYELIGAQLQEEL